MGLKEDSVAARLAQFQQAQSDAIGGAFDDGFSAGVASVPVGSGGGFTQADIDAAVAAAQGIDAQVLADAQAKAASDVAAVQQALVDMTSKEQIEESLVTNLQGAIGALQSSLDGIKAAVSSILNPPPAPVDVPPAA